MPTHRHGTQSFIDFMQTYLQDHPKRCKECGNVARARSEWRIEKRDEDGLHFVHTCPHGVARRTTCFSTLPQNTSDLGGREGYVQRLTYYWFKHPGFRYVTSVSGIYATRDGVTVCKNSRSMSNSR